MRRFSAASGIVPDPGGEFVRMCDFTYVYNRLRDLVDRAEVGALSLQEVAEARKLLEEIDRGDS